MKKKLSLFVFIDALGWEILKKHPDFLKDTADNRKPLRSILGYSNACDPSIISGLKPDQHKHWSSFYYSPGNCPYKWVNLLRIFPGSLLNRGRVRAKLSQIIAKVHKFTGYFQIYNVPFKHLSLFDYAEKQSIWVKDGLNKGKNIFDYFDAEGLKYYVPDGYYDDTKNLTDLKNEIERGEISLAYITLGKLDGIMHRVGTENEAVKQVIDDYDKNIRDLVSLGAKNYSEVNLYVFSDHGMHDVMESVDLISKIDQLNLTFGKDYVAIYDSTMARFWFLNETAKKAISDLLFNLDCGKILSEEELKQEGCWFPDGQYGELIFLMNPNKDISPSFMGLKGCPGMHGYSPEDKDTYASISSNCELPEKLKSIEEIFWLIMKEAQIDATDHPEHCPFS